MISMIPDLALLLALFGSQNADLSLSNTRASKAGKSGRSAVALKAIRMIRFSRLLRVLRVFRFFQTEDVDDQEQDPIDAGSSKVGQIVSEAVTKKVIVLVLVLVLVLPWFDPTSHSFSDAAVSTVQLYDKAVMSDISDQLWRTQCLDLFDEGITSAGAPILYVNTYDAQNDMHYTSINQASVIHSRRTIEMWSVNYQQSLVSETTVIFDIRASVYEEAGLGMCLTLFAIVIFATSTLFVTASTLNLVVAPIARLTELLMRMAGVIGLLGGAQTVENLIKDKDELFIVEALCERIMDIFGGGNASYVDPRQKNSKKALSMMASRKVTHITSGDRVWEIDVKEKHRTSLIERKVNRTFVEFRKSEHVQHPIDEEQLAQFEELQCLESIVDNPITMYCLRMFMMSNLTINNLLFCLEVRQFKSDIRRQFRQLYHKYVDDRSPAQINVSSKISNKIVNFEQMIIDEQQNQNNISVCRDVNDESSDGLQTQSSDSSNTSNSNKQKKKSNLKQSSDQLAAKQQELIISDNVFDEAMTETWQLMEQNIYKQFLQSDYCRFYVHMKQNDPLTLNQLQLSIPIDDPEAGPCRANVIRSSENGFPNHFSCER